MRIRYLALTATLGLATVLAACGGDDTGSFGDDDDGGSSLQETRAGAAEGANPYAALTDKAGGPTTRPDLDVGARRCSNDGHPTAP